MITRTNEDRGRTEHANGLAIDVDGITKRYGDSVVVNNLSFVARAGRVTGFLGPNGSGKSTTMRIMLDLARANSGRATIGERRYRDLANPACVVGADIEADAFHPGRSGRNHLCILADASGVSRIRIEEMLDLVGLTAAADRPVGGYSLGMRQRLGLAAALLGDPDVLVLDEPGNGLDPQGMRDLRGLLRERANAGGTVLVSSHLLSEVEQLADDVVVINHGELIVKGPLAELKQDAAVVRCSDADRLITTIELAGGDARLANDAVVVTGIPIDEIGQRSFEAGIVLYELSPKTGSLEDLFLSWTRAPVAS